MSRTSIAVGASFTSGVCTVALTLGNGNLNGVLGNALISSIATGALFLAGTKACKDEGQTLDKKDYIIIGGASLVGAMAGSTAIVAAAFAIYGIALGNLYGTLLGNMLSTPFRVLSCFGPRLCYYHPISTTYRG